MNPNSKSHKQKNRKVDVVKADTVHKKVGKLKESCNKEVFTLSLTKSSQASIYSPLLAKTFAPHLKYILLALKEKQLNFFFL